MKGEKIPFHVVYLHRTKWIASKVEGAERSFSVLRFQKVGTFDTEGIDLFSQR